MTQSCTITGPVVDPRGELITSRGITFKPASGAIGSSVGVVLPEILSLETSGAGELIDPADNGPAHLLGPARYVAETTLASGRVTRFIVSVPDASTATFADCVADNTLISEDLLVRLAAQRAALTALVAEAYSILDELDSFETSAELNLRDTANRARANHTGTQAISTITSLQTSLDSKVPATRQVSAGNGINGGGALSTDLAFNLAYANETQAIDGIDTVRVMSPFRVAQVIAAKSPVLALCAFDGTGTGTLAVEANGINVADVTRNAAGDYTVNFTTDLPHTNYAVIATPSRNLGAGNFSAVLRTSIARTVSGVRLVVQDQAGTDTDVPLLTVAVLGTP